MKKDRNAFFQNQSASSYYYPGNFGPNMNAFSYSGYPMATESSSNFYQGPILAPIGSNTNQNYADNSYNNEIESRLAKIERQISRLDTRLTKLESEMSSSIGSNSDFNTSNMYMV